MLQSVFNAFKIPDLRRKIIFTVLMLLVFRVIAHIPVPGVDLVRLEQLLQENQLLGMLNLFSGSALRNFSIAAMGSTPTSRRRSSSNCSSRSSRAWKS